MFGPKVYPIYYFFKDLDRLTRTGHEGHSFMANVIQLPNHTAFTIYDRQGIVQTVNALSDIIWVLDPYRASLTRYVPDKSPELFQVLSTLVLNYARGNNVRDVASTLARMEVESGSTLYIADPLTTT